MLALLTCYLSNLTLIFTSYLNLYLISYDELLAKAIYVVVFTFPMYHDIVYMNEIKSSFSNTTFSSSVCIENTFQDPSFARGISLPSKTHN